MLLQLHDFITKEGRVEKPLFDYEKLLYDALLVTDYQNPSSQRFKQKHLWVLKATGLGIRVLP